MLDNFIKMVLIHTRQRKKIKNEEESKTNILRRGDSIMLDKLECYCKHQDGVLVYLIGIAF